MHGLLVVKGKKKSHYKDLYDINRYYNILVFKIFVYDLLLIKKQTVDFIPYPWYCLQKINDFVKYKISLLYCYHKPTLISRIITMQ